MTARREAALGLFAATCVVMGLLAVFAIELSNTQAKSKQDVRARVHERGVLAVALIDGLFSTTTQQQPQLIKLYGSPTVSDRTLDRQLQQNVYLALLDSSGSVIAHSSGFTAQAQAELPSSAALALVRKGRPYALGNATPYGSGSVLDFAVPIPTPIGMRYLVTGFRSSQLAGFLVADLRKIPGVKGAHNYLIDGNGTVIASTNPAIPAGYRFTKPDQVKALRHTSGDVNGHYYDSVPLSNSTLRIVLAAPDGPLFSSVTGLRKWVPWAIFLALAMFALAALMLGRRSLRASALVREANVRLEEVNDELAATNTTLEKRARELARSNAELEQFASIASHDLQEPLRKVRTFTQQLTVIEADRLSDKGRDYLDRANAAAERMQRLIEDLLKFSRVATHGRPFEPVDLEQVTREVLEDLESQVHSTKAKVSVGELPTIQADPLQMRQLMQNLISNALKFAKPGVAPEVDISSQSTAGSVRIVVRDNGIGFEPQYSHRIFRVFERLHGRNEYPGTGIGLALCRKIAERHGGTVTADAEPGVGATFTVSLPARSGPTPESPHAADREREAEHVLA